MKKLLFISRPFLGESLFATPCIELLSKEYEIILICYPPYVSAFKQYTFIKKVLPGCNTTSDKAKLPEDTVAEIKKEFTSDIDGYYAYINDDDTPFWKNHPDLHHIKKYKVLTESEIKCMQKLDGKMYCISRTRHYMLKLQLLSLEELNNFDCTVRVPEFGVKERSDEIIVYEGSREVLRKLPTHIVSKFLEKLPTATYFVTEETAWLLSLKQKGVKHFIVYPYVDGVLEEIIQLFQSSPKVMIGPDSGLTQLALGYKIPYVWLQSRIPMESVIDMQYKNICHVYKKHDPCCLRNCVSWKADLTNNNLRHGLFDSFDAPKGSRLKCFSEKKPSCLEYSDEEINDIIKLSNDI